MFYQHGESEMGRVRLGLLAGVAVSALAVPELAAAQARSQTSPPPPAFTQPSPSSVSPPTASAEEASPKGSNVELSEVIVTGTRIARQDYSANTPVVTVGEVALEKTGSATLDTALKQLPQLVGSTGSTTNSSANQGQANIQLRGLGRQRTLVLLDGRRIVPANSDGSVDLNTLPTELIQNVEIITGGASAVYGSDAIAGVVNIRLKHHFEGLQLSAQYGVAGDGDAADYKLGLVGGAEFAGGRANTVFSLEYAKRDSVYLSDRDFTIGSNRDSVLPQGNVSLASGVPTQAALDAVFGKYGVAPGTVRSGNQFSFNQDGTLFSTGLTVQNYKGSTDPTLFAITPTQVLAEGRQFRFLQLPLETYTIFDRTAFDLNSTTHLYAQGFYSHNTSSTSVNPLPAPSSATNGVPLVPVTNPFIPADLRTLLASRVNPTAPFALSERLDPLGSRFIAGTNDIFQLIGGVEGRLPFRDWSYNAYVSYGETSISVERGKLVSRAALQSLLSAADGGASLCAGGFNPFGSNAISAACAAYIAPDLVSTQDLDQTVIEADLQGSLITLPTGMVRFAIGADYRRDGYSSVADPRIVANDIIAGSGSSFDGETDVKEVYGELSLPVLKGLPLAKKVDVDLGFRYSDYSSVGSVSTYKADLSWNVGAGVTLRGGYERAIRAPSVGELFSPVVQSATVIGLAGNFGSGDPCDTRGAYRKGSSGAQVRALCLAQGVPASIVDTFTFSQMSVGNVSGGNPGLHQETADTFSAGVVWRPPFSAELIKNISLSLDYYSIDLQDAVGSITAPLVLARCFNASGATNPTYDPTNLFCGRITRTADGTINQVSAQSLNLAGYKTSGFDIQVDWRFKTSALGLSDGGQIAVNLLANYLDSFKIQSLTGDPFLEYAGTIGNGQIDPVAISRPSWKANLYGSYSRGPALVGLTMRYIGDMRNAANVGNSGTSAGVTSVSYFDLNTRYQLTPKIELWGAITNLLDKDPPVYPSVGLTDLATYDVLGRKFTFGLRARF